MKKLINPWLFSGAIALLLFACQPTTTTSPDTSKDIEAVKTVLERIYAIWGNKNLDETTVLDSTLAFYTEDCVFLPPGGQRLNGKEELRQRWEAFFGTYHTGPVVNHALEDAQVSGDLAFIRHNATEVIVPRAGGESQTSHLLKVTIFKRQDDGSWKIIVHMANIRG